MRFLIQAIKIGAIVVLAGLTLVGARAAYDYAKVGAAKPTGQVVTIDVSKNESVASIGNDLKAKGLISDVNIFRVYVFATQRPNSFRRVRTRFRRACPCHRSWTALPGLK